MKTCLSFRGFVGLSIFAAMWIALSGCATKPAPAPSSGGASPDLAWDFRVKQAGDFWRGSVYLLVNGVPHKIVPVATAHYEKLQRKEFADYSVPAMAVLAAHSWHAGFGDILYVIEKPGQLEVYRQEMDESETSHYPVKRVALISF